ncbi:MAG: divalent-cation tolerance protein CutA [Dehalococcoidales bacterium]
MEELAYVVLFITASNIEEANKIAEVLLNQRKAACVNIVPGVSSLFWWQDKLDSAQESLLIVKTKASLLPEVISLVKGVHSYDVPEIIALPIVGGNQDYLEWIDKEVK